MVAMTGALVGSQRVRLTARAAILDTGTTLITCSNADARAINSVRALGLPGRPAKEHARAPLRDQLDRQCIDEGGGSLDMNCFSGRHVVFASASMLNSVCSSLTLHTDVMRTHAAAARRELPAAGKAVAHGRRL